VDVGDRGADIYEAMVAAQAQGHDFLFRLTQNRDVWLTPERGALTKLRDFARGLASQGRDIVDIPGRGGARDQCGVGSRAGVDSGAFGNTPTFRSAGGCRLGSAHLGSQPAGGRRRPGMDFDHFGADGHDRGSGR